MFHSEKFGSNVMARQSRDASMAWDLDDKKLWENLPDVNDIRPEPGLNKGLRLVLDSHSDIISSGSVSRDDLGFQAIVSPR